MIMETIVMMISLRTVKNSHMTFPLSPIFPMHIPKVMKKPIKPSENKSVMQVKHHHASKMIIQQAQQNEAGIKEYGLTKNVHAPFVLQPPRADHHRFCLVR